MAFNPSCHSFSIHERLVLEANTFRDLLNRPSDVRLSAAAERDACLEHDCEELVVSGLSRHKLRNQSFGFGRLVEQIDPVSKMEPSGFRPKVFPGFPSCLQASLLQPF